MYLQNLLKKLAEIFSAKTFKDLLINNFRDLLLITGSICFIILVIVFFVAISGNNKSKDYNLNNVDISRQESSLEQKSVYYDEFLLTADDFVLPDIESFDVTSDYVDFLPAKKFQSPDNSLVEKEFKNIVDDTVEDSTKFIFEKRRKSMGDKE